MLIVTATNTFSFLSKSEISTTWRFLSIIQVGDTSFSHVYRLLKQPHRLPPKMTENLSVPLAFLGIHLTPQPYVRLVFFGP